MRFQIRKTQDTEEKWSIKETKSLITLKKSVGKKCYKNIIIIEPCCLIPGPWV